MTSEQLRTARIRLGYTQKELAEGLEISRSSLQRWENGRWPVPKLAAFAIMGLLAKIPKARG